MPANRNVTLVHDRTSVNGGFFSLYKEKKGRYFVNHTIFHNMKAAHSSGIVQFPIDHTASSYTHAKGIKTNFLCVFQRTP